MPDSVLIAVRFVHYASVASLAGALLFQWSIASPALRRGGANAAAKALVLRRRLLALCWVSLVAAVVSAALWLLVLSADITGAPFGRALSDGTAAAVLARTRFGRDWLVRFVLALLLAVALASMGRGTSGREPASAWSGRPNGPQALLASAGAAILAMCLVGTLAWAGHCGAIPGVAGRVQLAADFLHLSAAAAWLGALVPLAMLLGAVADSSDRAWVDIARAVLARFSTMGTLAVSTLVVTGAANAWVLVGSIPALTGTHYGRLLLLKEAFFVSMLALAAVNRFRLAPRLSMRQLQRNSLVEALFGIAVLAAVAVLGTVTPAAAMH